MTIGEIAATAAMLLGLDDLAREITSGETQGDATQKMIAAVNRAVRTVAVRYLPPEHRQEMEGVEAVAFSEFEKLPTSIREVTGEDGKQRKFAVRGEVVFLPPEKVTVRYRYLPAIATADQACDYSESTLPREVLAAGAAAEYCISDGRYEDADVWAAYFRQGVLAANAKSRRIRAWRRWL